MNTTTLQPHAARDAGHTPGPWETGSFMTQVVIHPPGWRVPLIIADCHPMRGYCAKSEAERCANSALIASAPEMLAALKAAAELLTNLGNEIQDNIGEVDYNSQFIPAVRNAALSAIAKAERRAE